MRPITAEDMWKIPRVGIPIASERWLVVPVTAWEDATDTNITRLWRMRPDGGDPRPLTSSRSSATRPALSPDGSRVSFVRTADDRAQIHVMSTDGGEAHAVSEVGGTVVGSTWGPDGRCLYVMSNVGGSAESGVHATEDALYRYWDRWLTNGSRPHLFEVDTADWSVRDLTPDQDKWMRWENTGDPIADVAVSGERLVYCAMRPQPPFREPRWSLYEIDLHESGERELTTRLDGHASMPRFGPDGTLVTGLQFVPDYYADPVRLARIGEDGDHELLDFGDWDRSVGSWEFDGERLLLTAEDRGTVRLYEWAGSGEPRPLTTGGSVNGFAATESHTVVSHSSLITPPEIHGVHQSALERITTFTTESLEGIDLPRVSEITVTGSESAPVQTYLLSTGEGPRPLVHMIHGGPHGVFGDQWHWRWNAAVLAGSDYTVALVNFAGSTSFGDDFATSIHGAWGDRPAADIEAVTDHLVAEGLADPERMAISGGSYGGYLVSWLITRTDRYRCAIAHAAVTDLPGMYASDVTMGLARAYGAEAWEDPERVQRWSPLSHAADVVTPTLVIHGDRDYRVPVGQGLELYGMLHAKGVPARLVHFDDEGHWILDRNRSLRWYEEVTAWLDRHLGP